MAVEIIAYSGLIRNHSVLARRLNINEEKTSRREREKAIMIRAYETWGHDMGAHVNGQFGVALFDTETKELFATRDLIGAELLYYRLNPEFGMTVSTRITDLITDCPEQKVNENMIRFYMAFTYVPGECTLFEGIQKVEPGGWVSYGAKGFEKGHYREIAFDFDHSKDLDGWSDAIEHVIEKSLKDISDDGSPLSCFLSSGVDSSFIFAKSDASTGICVSYDEEHSSEKAQAKATAESFGREFEEIKVTAGEFLASVDDFLLSCEQPQGDVAGLALFCACKKLSKHKEPILSGEGADELFAGYNGYGNARKLRMMPGVGYHGATYIMNKSEQSRYLKKFTMNPSTDTFIKKRCAKGRRYDDISWMLYTDMRSYFEGSILFNTASIAHGTGLDIRMPFCDLRMIGIALRMPSPFKWNASGNKIALRHAARRILPHETAYRRKLGFPVPVDTWFRRPDFMAEFRSAFESETADKFFDIEELRILLDVFQGKPPMRHPIWFARRPGLLWRYVWVFYTFIRWYELFFCDGNRKPLREI